MTRRRDMTDEQRAERHKVALVRAQRTKTAMELRAAGLTYRAIGEQLGVNEETARTTVARAMMAAVREPTQAVIATERARLEELHQALWDDALAGDLDATDRVLRLMERRAKLLGLDAPTRTITEAPLWAGLPSAERLRRIEEARAKLDALEMSIRAEMATDATGDAPCE